MPNENERPPQPSSTPPPLFKFGMVGVLLASAVFILVSFPRGGGPPLWYLIAVGVTLAGVVVSVVAGLAVADRRRQAEVRHIHDSRARLAEAERELEDALRVDRNAVVHGARVVTAGRDSFVVNGGGLHPGDIPKPGPSPDTEDDVDEEPQAQAPHLALPELWKTTHARLKLYHDVALGHADRSFRSAQYAMWAGFVALGAFVAVAFNASNTAGSVIAGGLGAVSAALAGFIGRTFVRSQETAAEHLRSYFDQPLELSRYLAAERLIADATLDNERRAEVLTALVTAMVAGPPQPPTDAANPPQQAVR
ncbi:hypothetical protein [Streptomyces sp. NPDC058280]|uniref:hypothetical protein n=1 Tax=Streptomyces sp. NPDC058280 TaxID=3346419 RepID=UPI0036E1F565